MRRRPSAERPSQQSAYQDAICLRRVPTEWQVVSWRRFSWAKRKLSPRADRQQEPDGSISSPARAPLWPIVTSRASSGRQACFCCCQKELGYNERRSGGPCSGCSTREGQPAESAVRAQGAAQFVARRRVVFVLRRGGASQAGAACQARSCKSPLARIT